MSVVQYRLDSLFSEEVSLAHVAERFGTPTYVYSRAAILENLNRVILPIERLGGMVCYSVKANSGLAILKLLGDAGSGFDVVSGGELARVERSGARPERVIFSGVGKTCGEIDAALEAGILMINVESAGEIDLVEARARHRGGARAAISIRINPDVEASTHPYISTGRAIHKFGVPKSEAPALYRRAAASPHLEVRGVACHIGSQILEVEPFLRAAGEVLALARDLGANGIDPRFIDLGGGFGICYHNEPPFDLERFLAALDSMFQGSRFRPIVEPGRSLVGEAGVLLARVLYVKENGPKRFVVVDAGMNDLLRPALYGSYHRIVPVERRPGASQEPLGLADVVGPLCETGDFLAQDREMPTVEPGDFLAILDAGAYGYSLASNYNSRPRPAEVLLGGNEARLIRRRETVEDLMEGELI